MLSFLPEPIERYLITHSTSESDLLRALARETRAETSNPQMQVGIIEGLFLKFLARSLGARRVLEIGTFTGYSALMMAEGIADGGEVITCDIDRRAAAIAQKCWAKSPHGKKITLKLGRALDTVRDVPEPIDMVFIDADKKNYVHYWEACVPKVRTGGILIADNVLWSGRVLKPSEPDDHALAAFNGHVTSDTRVESVMLPIRDGITLATRI